MNKGHRKNINRNTRIGLLGGLAGLILLTGCGVQTHVASPSDPPAQKPDTVTLPHTPPGVTWQALEVPGHPITAIWIPVPTTWTRATLHRGINGTISAGWSSKIGQRLTSNHMVQTVGYGVSIYPVAGSIQMFETSSMGKHQHWSAASKLNGQAVVRSSVLHAFGGQQDGRIELIGNGSETIVVMIYVPSREAKTERMMLRDIRAARNGAMPSPVPDQ